MKTVFDHCVPRTLARALPNHVVRTARDEGWDQLTNGSLIGAAEQAGFQVLLTVDRGFKTQQNLAGKAIGVLVVETFPLTSRRLIELASEIEDEISLVAPGTVRVLTR